MSEVSPNAGPVLLGRALYTPLAITLGAVVLSYPAVTVTQRYCLQYIPKRDLQQDDHGFLTIFQSVWKREGLSGLYKGALVELCRGLAVIVPNALITLLILPSLPPWLSQPRPSTSALTTATAAIGAVVLQIPFQIATARLVASSKHFPTTTPFSNLRSLFSHKERSHPLQHLITPSRLLATLIPWTGVQLVRYFLGPAGESLAGFSIGQTRLFRLGIEAILSLASLPFTVIPDRLNAQRVEDAHTPAEEGEKMVTKRGGGEQAIDQETSVELRKLPYKGLKDCYTSIVEEEGYRTLFRGWQLDLAFVLGAGYLSYYTEAVDRAVKVLIDAAK